MSKSWETLDVVCDSVFGKLSYVCARLGLRED